jgi:hypothetical protein
MNVETRQRFREITDRIAKREPVSCTDMAWAQKWAMHNHNADTNLRRARQIATQSKHIEENEDDRIMRIRKHRSRVESQLKLYNDLNY